MSIDKILEDLRRFNDLEETFWQWFSMHYPPDNFETEINKIPKRFRQAYFENGVDFKLDLDPYTNPLRKITIIPDGYSPTDCPNLIDDADQSEFSIISDALCSIAKALQEKIENDPNFDIFKEAVEIWEKEKEKAEHEVIYGAIE